MFPALFLAIDPVYPYIRPASVSGAGHNTGARAPPASKDPAAARFRHGCPAIAGQMPPDPQAQAPDAG